MNEPILDDLRGLYRRAVLASDKTIIERAAQAIAKTAHDASTARVAAPAAPTPTDTAFEGDAVLVGVHRGIIVGYDGGLYVVAYPKWSEFGVEWRLLYCRNEQMTALARRPLGSLQLSRPETTTP